MKYFSMAFLLVITLSVSGVVAADDVISSARTLIQSEKYVQAFELLDPIESTYSGNPEYDLLLGVSALQTEHVTRSIFALERVLDVQPNNTEARALLGKAYFKLGELQSAKVAFETSLEAGVPDEFKDSINRLLSAIDDEINGTRGRLGAFIEFTLGHDSNVNSATSTNQVAIPLFGGAIFNLSSNATEKSSNFINPAIGIHFSKGLAKDVAVFGSAILNKRINWKTSAEAFDTGSQDFSLGVRKVAGINTLTLAVQSNNFYLDSATYRHANGVIGQWQRDVTDHDQANVFAQYTKLEYPSQNVRDANRYVLGGGWGHAISMTGSPVVYGSLYLGEEDETKSGFSYLGHHLVGAKLGGELGLTPKTRIYAGLGYEARNYGGSEPLWNTSRRDTQWDFNVGARITPIANWLIRPNFSYTNNDSNVPVSDYDRWQLSVTFHHDLNW